MEPIGGYTLNHGRERPRGSKFFTAARPVLPIFRCRVSLARRQGLIAISPRLRVNGFRVQFADTHGPAAIGIVDSGRGERSLPARLGEISVGFLRFSKPNK